jgi:tripartite-type tricarboxylate transporter receptor subunit TctC
MNRRDVVRAARTLCLTALAPPALGAQATWPSRPMRWVVGYPAGGPMDTFARLIGGALGDRLGQPVVVDSRPGAGAIVATETVLRAPADGHTLLTADNGMLVYNPALYARLPFDPDRDLVRVGLIGRFALFLVVRNGSPFGSFAEFQAAARDAQLAFGSPGVASPHHLAMEVLKRHGGFEVLHVPYRGMPALLQELLAGRVEVAIGDIVSVAPALRSGDVRALAALQATRSALFPEVPAVRELGYPEITAGGWLGVCVANGTPGEIVARLAAAIQEAVAAEPVAEELRRRGAEMAGAGPQAFDALVQAEAATWRPLIRELGLRPDR